MITLCMDTSHIYLSLALIRDDEIIGEVQEECWKHQSEEIFPKLAFKNLSFEILIMIS